MVDTQNSIKHYMSAKRLQFSHPSQEDSLIEMTGKEEYLSQILKQKLELIGEEEKVIDLLVLKGDAKVHCAVTG